MNNTRVSIIGLGQVGTTFLKVLSHHNFKIVSAFNRSEISSSLIKKFPECSFVKGMPSAGDELGDLIFITVSDDAIPKVAEDLADFIEESVGKSAVHCSGTYSSQVLKALKEKGLSVASFHPIKAITKSTESFDNIWFDMEGDEKLLLQLEEIARTMGAYSFRIKPEAKPYLHASAVVASNYLVVLVDLVSRISSQGNIPEATAIKALTPLMENTLSNIKELGIKDALTGPIARGDVKTIEKHLQSLASAPELLKWYKNLGAEALKIAESKKGPSSLFDKIKNLLR